MIIFLKRLVFNEIKRNEMKKLFLLLLCLFTQIKGVNELSKLGKPSNIKVFTNESRYFDNIKESLNKFDIAYELVGSVRNDDQNLYIIFDLFKIDEKNLPKYYIAYQTLDLTKNILTTEYFKKLLRSVAVWDYSKENIDTYNSRIYNYFYFPKDYEYADPAILSCLMPISTLDTYKDLLLYSNKKNTDISSHLPTLFYYCILQDPKLLVEAGVRGGESTISFGKAQEFCDTHLIGIDIDQTCEASYKRENSTFLCMDDLNFCKYYNKSVFSEKKLDVVFIDTSHLYMQTIQEIKTFAPLLNENGMLMFHDSNVTPLMDGSAYLRLNGTFSGNCFGNTRGVTQAIKEYLSLNFDESKYCNFICQQEATTWQIIHYPFCNGLTILKKLPNPF